MSFQRHSVPSEGLSGVFSFFCGHMAIRQHVTCQLLATLITDVMQENNNLEMNSSWTRQLMANTH